MRLVFFLRNLASGGVQKRTLRLIEGLLNIDENDEFDITLIVDEPEGAHLDLVHQDVELIILNSKNSFETVVNLKSHLKTIRPDIVITCMGQEFIKSLFASFISVPEAKLVIIQAVPVRLPGESKAQNFIRSFAIWLFYNFADQIVSVSNDVKNSLISLRTSLGEKIRVIYNPVVKKEITTLSNKEISHPFFQNGSKVLVSVGRLHLQKDYPTLIKAFKQAKKTTDFPLKLIILGEGEKRDLLEDLIKKNNLSTDIDLVGYKENPFAYMRQADLFVMSSLWEGLPSALIEALAVGTPVVSTDCKAGPREILKNGKYGTLVPVSDSEALAKGIEEELNKKRDPFELISRSEEFSIENSVAQYSKLFKKIG